MNKQYLKNADGLCLSLSDIEEANRFIQGKRWR